MQTQLAHYPRTIFGNLRSDAISVKYQVQAGACPKEGIVVVVADSFMKVEAEYILFDMPEGTFV